jgi:hypothetical protein
MNAVDGFQFRDKDTRLYYREFHDSVPDLP